MIPRISARLRSRLSWSVLAIALVSYVCLGIAEQGAPGSVAATPPTEPLPFPRERVFGLDLSDYTSLEAVEWLEAAGNDRLALIVIPIDADVVTALGEPEAQPRAIAAMDRLVAAGNGSPLAACLREPPGAGGGYAAAEAAILELADRYPNQISYVFACNMIENQPWHRDIARAAVVPGRVADIATSWIPVASGSPVRVIEFGRIESMRTDGPLNIPSAGYSLLGIEIQEPIDADNARVAADALSESPTAGLVLLRPARGLDPATIVASIRDAQLPGGILPDGFSSITAPVFGLSEGWRPFSVGTVSYLQATSSDATMTADFFGTDVYLLALRSPQAGSVNVWIDPTGTTIQRAPDLTINLSASQAHDTAIPLTTGLPATRHRVVIQAVNTEGTSVAVSGMFVSGKPSESWTGLMAAFALVAIAIAALTERCHASVAAIRANTGRRQSANERRHPRVFSGRR